MLVQPVGDLEQLSGIKRVFAAVVDFKLDTEKELMRIVGRKEDRIGFVGIVVDEAPFALMRIIATIAVFVIVVVNPIGVVEANDGAAALACAIVVVVAALAERSIGVAGVVLSPYPLAATGAKDCQLFFTCGTEVLVVNTNDVPGRKILHTSRTSKQLLLISTH
jgi:hypothetical protein